MRAQLAALTPGRTFIRGLNRAKEAPELMFSCAKIRELQSESRGGTVTLLQRLGLWLHTRLCPPCAHTGKTLDRTLDLLRDLGSREKK